MCSEGVAALPPFHGKGGRRGDFKDAGAEGAWVAGGAQGAEPALAAPDTAYVRSDACGDNTGRDWHNALTTLPARLTRGHAYYIADGFYDSHRFDQWIHEHPQAVAVVSQIGTPSHATPDTMEGWPPFFCDFVGPSNNWETLLKAGRVHAVIAQLPTAVLPETIPPGKSWQQLFDSQYQLLRPPTQ